MCIISVSYTHLDVYKRQVVNPQRACICMGSPGSGNSYCIVNQFIKQQIEKGYTQYIYDYKLDVYKRQARNDDLEHVGLFQAQEDTSRFLPLLVC